MFLSSGDAWDGSRRPLYSIFLSKHKARVDTLYPQYGLESRDGIPKQNCIDVIPDLHPMASRFSARLSHSPLAFIELAFTNNGGTFLRSGRNCYISQIILTKIGYRIPLKQQRFDCCNLYWNERLSC